MNEKQRINANLPILYKELILVSLMFFILFIIIIIIIIF